MSVGDENVPVPDNGSDDPEAVVPRGKFALIKSINDMRKRAAVELSDIEDRKSGSKEDEARIVQLQARLRLLNRSTLPLYRASENDYMKSVFISYVKNTEDPGFYDQAYTEFAKSSYEISGGYGEGSEKFEVRTGFERQREAQIVDNIADLIGRSTAFLGLWTFPDDAIEGAPPGHWLPLELGMAVALRKPFRIVVDHRIDPQWYLKPLRGVIHTVYDPLAPAGKPQGTQRPNFQWAIEEARIALDQRLEEKLFASTGADIADEFLR